MTWALCACSSGVDLGRPYALERGAKAAASASASSSSLSRKASSWGIISSMRPCTSAYFLLPLVRLATMAPRDAAMAPAMAEAPPPPGVGALEVSSPKKPSTVCSRNTKPTPLQEVQVQHGLLLGLNPLEARGREAGTARAARQGAWAQATAQTLQEPRTGPRSCRRA